jgi:hypothetical protein
LSAKGVAGGGLEESGFVIVIFLPVFNFGDLSEKWLPGL